MSSAPRYEDWDDLVGIVQRYSVRKYGQQAIGITIHLYHGEAHREPLPPGLPMYAPPKPPAGPQTHPGVKKPGWVKGDGPEHLTDFQQVWWPALGLFKFTPKQAIVVKLLWEAMEDGTDSVGQEILLRACDSDCTRLRDLFSRNPAWGSLIVSSGGGTYRLIPLEMDDDSE